MALEIPKHDYAMPYVPLSDDEQIVQLLIQTWTLMTGRTLRSDVPPQELTEQELMDFWSDYEPEPGAES